MNNSLDVNMKRTCSKCQTQKAADQFNKGDSCCRSCKKLQRKTPKELIGNMYSSQRRSVGENHVHYSKQELFDYFNQQEQFHELYAKWKESGYLPALTPTCRRHDMAKGFSFDNIYIAANKSKSKSVKRKSKRANTGFLRGISSFMKNLLGGDNHE